MASKLAPSDPSSCMVIRQITPNITTLSLPFARFGHAKIGGRATLIKLPSGSVAVFSPVALTSAAKEAAAAMGPVKYVAALDMEHHLFLPEWQAAFPEAKMIAPAGLKEKRKASGAPSVRFDVQFKDGQTQSGGGEGRLSVDGDGEFDQTFDMEFVAEHGNKELVFNFRPEKTMIQADLFFNLPAIEQYSKSGDNPHSGITTKLFNALWGTSGSALNWQRRVIWYLIAGDRQKFAESVGRINAWEFDRVVPCHGDVIETGGKTVFRSVFAWFLQGQTTSASA